MWPLVLSRIARWAWRSLARFLANWSGVRLATPLDDMLFSLRLRPDVVPLSKSPSASIEAARGGIGESSGLLRGVGCER